MDRLLIVYVVGVASVLALAFLSIWAPRKARIRLLAIALVALTLPAGYVSYSDLLSRPKPASIEWARRTVPEATVISAQMHEGKAIHLWLQLPGAKEPRGYTFPWSQKLARQLVRAQRTAKQRGTKVRIRKPFSKDDGYESSRFYAHRHRPLTAKQSPTGTALHYSHPGR